ncbi:MAG: twin-arginine translocation signal domain-containing protein [Rickettsiales bacterium]|nr:twin-arginine translocation signal domain-containing protein [Rickettsiales bacterium]
MMTRRTVLMTSLAVATAMLLAGCASEKIEVLKSPCVGLEGSPCGPKRPMNGALNPAMPEHS